MNKAAKPPKNIALEKKQQRKFDKDVHKLTKRIKELDSTADVESLETKGRGVKRGVVYLSHLPHGFYEEEMRKYFHQFGAVTKIRVLRSNKTGGSKGCAFVQFKFAEVAKLVAETMDNYLMFNRRIVAKYLPPEKVPPNVFANKRFFTETNYRKLHMRKAHKQQKNETVYDEEKHKKKILQKIEKLKQKDMLDCCQIGFLDFPVEVDGVKTLNIAPVEQTQTKQTTTGKTKTTKTEEKSAIKLEEINKKTKSAKKKARVAKKKAKLAKKLKLDLGNADKLKVYVSPKKKVEKGKSPKAKEVPKTITKSKEQKQKEKTKKVSVSSKAIKKEKAKHDKKVKKMLKVIAPTNIKTEIKFKH